jgi:hypothetical protein
LPNFFKFKAYVSFILVFTLVSCSKGYEESITKQPMTVVETASPAITPDTKKDDAQLTWYPRPHSQFKKPKGIQSLYDSTFVDSLHGWYLSSTENDGMELYRTEDGGNLWIRIAGSKSKVKDNTFPKYGTQSLSFLNTQVGWLLGGFREGDYARFWIYATSDGGVTWQRVVLPLPLELKNATPITTTTSINSYKLWFFNDNDGVLLMQAAEQDAKNQWVYFTHDSGKTWVDPQIVGNGIWKGTSGNIDWDFSISTHYTIVIDQVKWVTIDDYHEIWTNK